VLAVSAVVLALVSGDAIAGRAPLRAQASETTLGHTASGGFMQSASVGRLERLKERTTETWAQMKRRWSLQREKYAACRKEARHRRLAGRKTRKFLEGCMGPGTFPL
jgi:hypothetical protein